MQAQSVKFVLASVEDEQKIIPLMAAFNDAEGIVGRPESMTAALRRLLREPELGLVLAAEAAWRGRGVGRSLLDAIVEKLRLSGAKAVHLMVRPENERALSLYQSRGFRVAPRILLTKQVAFGE